ncbi:shikimate dehydrogenase [Burkholderia sp. SR8]|uniref:shikimate dehydrogenase family protein n=1 Tax=Burkholderia sp. SR8 TaxID=3062277 RepID=UPI004063CEFF
MNINGSTRLIGIVGDPIKQARAPEVWTRLFRYNRINAVCVPMQVAADELSSFIDGVKAVRNLVGLIITVPHKTAVLELVDNPTARARSVGAVNMLRWNKDGKVTGDIVDGAGFVLGLNARGRAVSGKRALVVGSGGAGTAIAFALAEAGAAEVDVSDINEARAQQLASRLRLTGVQSCVSPPIAVGFDIVVNASPIGMHPDDPLPMNIEGLGEGTLVAEAIMHPPETRLLAQARACGCPVQPGSYMMDYQIPEMASFFGFDNGKWSPEDVLEISAQG